MNPLDEFYERLALFNTSMTAHMARILDRNGLLDDETRRLINAVLPGLAECAERCADEQVEQLLDLLVEVLPPRQP